MKRIFLVNIFTFTITLTFGQIVQSDSTEIINDIKDSIYIAETENVKGKDKVLHAEPLFIDLIRDLGARKGEKEWNVGLGMTDRKTFDSYSGLIEYEFAPVNRLGFEIELPFTFYYPTEKGIQKSDIPRSKLNSVKLATQYSFFVSEKHSTSMAIGYIHELELISFNRYGKEKPIKGNIYNPFFIVAKRWGANFHTLVYSGPLIEHHLNALSTNTIWQINSSLHYMIPGTRNFIGIEFNKEAYKGDFDMTIRPQMRLAIAENFLLGIVTGIPINRENQRLSSFVRLIYEPKHKKKL